MMDGRLVVAFDVDGVLADFMGGCAVWARRMFGEKMSVRPRKWDDSERIKQFIASPGSYLGLGSLAAPLEWARIAALHYDHYVYFVTSRNTAGRQNMTCQEQTARWLRGADPAMENILPSVVCTGRAGSKLYALQHLKVDFYIDDNGDHVAHAVKGVPQTSSFLLRRPWNSSYKVPFVRRLSQFLDKVERAEWAREEI